ncbi:MAG TPA: SCE4755 family polysaccharide monooxygenase-like protein [Polyangia bacterium]
MLLGAIVLLAPTRADAHFKITDPTTPPKAATVQSWMSQDTVGGPQKNGPCAATPNTSLGDSQGTPVANAVTVVQPGQTVTVPVTITIAHPGWFRISLAQGASSTQTLTALPDPKAQTGTNCTPTIMTNPVWSTTQPILADGLPAGSTASTQQSGSKTFTVTIPSTASCSTAQPCSLQIVMVMTDHPADDCYYHHCADVVVSSGGSGGGSSGSGGAAATGGAGGRGSGGSGAGGIGAGGSGNAAGSLGQGGSTGTASGGSPGQGGSTGTASGGSPGTGGGTETGGSGASATGGSGTVILTGAGASGGTSQSGSSGCTVSGHAQASSQAFWAFGAAGLLALVIARRRRR